MGSDARATFMPTILGIESTCDETAAAVVVDGFDVRSNVVASQVELHAKYRGVVPESAFIGKPFLAHLPSRVISGKGTDGDTGRIIPDWSRIRWLR